jgi:hypothetical protein
MISYVLLARELYLDERCEYTTQLDSTSESVRLDGTLRRRVECTQRGEAVAEDRAALSVSAREVRIAIGRLQCENANVGRSRGEDEVSMRSHILMSALTSSYELSQ